jgi:rubrerythrin
MKYPDIFRANNVISEATLTSEERNRLKDTDFGIPELRKYPLNDEVHVIQAIRFFKDAPEKYRKELAERIVSKAKEYNMDWESWNVLKPYLVKTVKESFNMSNFVRDPSALKTFMESDAKNEDEKETDENDSRNLTIEELEDFDDDDKIFTSGDFDEFADDVNLEDNDINNIEIGIDDSDVHNEYDVKEVETLNNLIAAENDAMNDYFEAGKNTNQEILRRLYADIGAEERFHAEQLIYAKSTITGEKYEPRDPEVKKEYEELLEMGVDEETAMTTAVDKLGFIRTDDGDDSDLEDLEEDVSVMEESFQFFSMAYDLTEAILSESSKYEKGDDEISKQLDVFVETCCYTEAVDNISSNNRSHGTNPINIILNGFRTLLRFISRLIEQIKRFIRFIQVKHNRIHGWIKSHGIKDLFANGIYMYFYDEKRPGEVSTEPLQYTELIFNVMRLIGKRIGITNFKQPYQKGSWNSIPFNGVEDGLDKIKNTVITKTKVVVTDANEARLAAFFFGYTQAKNSSGNSINVNNSLTEMADQVNAVARIADEFADYLKAYESEPNSIYYKNRKLYNWAFDGLKTVREGLVKFTKALNNDLNAIIKLNNGILESTRDADEADKNKSIKR